MINSTNHLQPNSKPKRSVPYNTTNINEFVALQKLWKKTPQSELGQNIHAFKLLLKGKSSL